MFPGRETWEGSCPEIRSGLFRIASQGAFALHRLVGSRAIAINCGSLPSARTPRSPAGRSWPDRTRSSLCKSVSVAAGLTQELQYFAFGTMPLPSQQHHHDDTKNHLLISSLRLFEQSYPLQSGTSIIGKQEKSSSEFSDDHGVRKQARNGRKETSTCNTLQLGLLHSVKIHDLFQGVHGADELSPSFQDYLRNILERQLSSEEQVHRNFIRCVQNNGRGRPSCSSAWYAALSSGNLLCQALGR